MRKRRSETPGVCLSMRQLPRALRALGEGVYQLDAVVGAPLHELAIEHVLLVTAPFGHKHSTRESLRQRQRKGDPFSK